MTGMGDKRHQIAHADCDADGRVVIREGPRRYSLDNILHNHRARWNWSTQPAVQTLPPDEADEVLAMQPHHALPADSMPPPPLRPLPLPKAQPKRHQPMPNLRECMVWVWAVAASVVAVSMLLR